LAAIRNLPWWAWVIIGAVVIGLLLLLAKIVASFGRY
jgi:hypothetical protein